MNNKLISAVATGTALIVLGLTSCGGGSSAPNPPGGGNNGPAPGTANIQGQLVEGSGGRVVSTAGTGLAGIPVTLINAVNGALQGSTASGSGGNFEFKAIPSNGSYLLKVEFTSTKDLDGDGVNDQVEMYFPVSVADQSITSLTQALGFDDSNNDGVDDSINSSTDIVDDHGRHESHDSQHRFRDGMTVVDSNGNGTFSDDSGFDDSNCDNLPDDSNHDGSPDSGSGVGSVELVGALEALSATSITVAGTTFAVSSSTEFKFGTQSHASPSLFVVGTQVKVEAFDSGSGLVATEVKGGGDDGVDDDPGVDDHPGSDDGSGHDSGDDNGGSGGGTDDGSGGGDSGSGGGGDDGTGDQGHGDN